MIAPLKNETMKLVTTCHDEKTARTADAGSSKAESIIAKAFSYLIARRLYVSVFALFLAGMLMATSAQAIVVKRNIAAGGSHSLFLKADGTVWASGANGDGQLGDGTYTDRFTATRVSGLSDIVAVAAGVSHSLFLGSDGTVWACGRNTLGQLGNGVWGYTEATPVHVSGLSGIVAIAAGETHSLFLKDDGTVWACGYNASGQLGNGTLDAQNTPVQIPALTHVTAIAAGSTHSLFLMDDGTAWACGNNVVGQLGIGHTFTVLGPVQVDIPINVVAIAAGGEHSVFAGSDGSAWFTGRFSYGGFGIGPSSQYNSPIVIPTLSGITAVSAGYYYSLFLKSNGTVWAFGDNGAGQLGNGTTGSYEAPPVQVSGMTGATEIASGLMHSLFLRDSCAVWACGANYSGAFGSGTATIHTVPVQAVSRCPGMCNIDVNDIVLATATSTCPGGSSTVTINSPTLMADSIYSVHYTLSGPAGNSGTYLSAPLVYGAGTGQFIIDAAHLTNEGATTITINSIKHGSCNSDVITANNTATISINRLSNVTIATSGPTSICSGEGLTLSASNAAGNTLHFGGSTYGEGTNTRLPQGNAARTIEAWINPDFATNGTVYNWGPNSYNSRSGLLYIFGRLYFVGESNDLMGGTILPTGTWSHVAITFDETTIKLYVNGVLDGARVTTLATAGYNYRIGVSSGGFGEFFYGKIDELRIWNIALSQTQIVANMNTGVAAGASNLVAYYKFNETSGAIAEDVMQNGTATLFNASANIPSDAPLHYNSYVWSPVGAVTSTIQPAISNSYSVTVTDADGCSGTSDGVNITVNPTPAVFNVTGGGAVCVGSVLPHISLSGSEPNVFYTLYNNGYMVTWQPGNGNALDFGAQMATGDYTIFAQNIAGCGTYMTGTVTITAGTPPAVYNVTGGGAMCEGSAVPRVSLSGSEPNVLYMLYNNGSMVTSQPGDGNALDFGAQMAIGDYTIFARNITGCGAYMTGTVTVTGGSSPAVYNVTGGGSMCAGGSGVQIGLSNSASSINYELYKDGIMLESRPGIDGPLDFTLQTAVGTYSVVAIHSTSGCTTNMSGTATVAVSPSPAVYNATGGGTMCSDGGGFPIGTSGSSIGVRYDLSRGGILAGSRVGTGGVLSFGPQAVAGTYSVVAVDITTGCSSRMMNNPTITILPGLTSYIVSGGGDMCAGSAGRDVYLEGSTAGVTYRLYCNGSFVRALTGDGNELHFGVQTNAGNYTVAGYNPETGCTGNMTGRAVISFIAAPTAYPVTGGGAYCDGGSGVAVGLSGSANDISYILYHNGVPGITMTGNGGALNFGPQTAPGAYTVLTIDPSSGCTAQMTGTTTVTVNPSPTVYNVTGGGAMCAGGSGVQIGLNNSAAIVTYQLYKDGVMLETRPGVDGPLNFTLQTAAGTYSVVGIHSTYGCTANMNGTATVTVYPPLAVYNVTGGGTMCAGDSGVQIGLSNSAATVRYELYKDGVMLETRPGVDGPLNFYLQSSVGTYSVVGIHSTYGCTARMNGTATITVNPSPAVYSVTGGGAMCSGGNGVQIGLNNSAATVTYQLYKDGVMLETRPGVDGPLNFTLQASAGTYSVVGMHSTSGCTANMNGTAAVTVYPPIAVYNVTGGGTMCAGGSGVQIGLSNSAATVRYELYKDGVMLETRPGVDGPLNFYLQSSAGTYSVVGIHSTYGCTARMNGTATVTVNPSPAVYSVTGGGAMCTGGTGVQIGLGNSASTVIYQLYKDGVLFETRPGVDGPLNFTLQSSAGTYSVVGIHSTSGCTASMNGVATVTVTPVPGPITGTSTIMAGSTITLSNPIAGGVWTSASTAKATVNPTNGVVTGVSAGIAVISYTMGGACSATTTVIVNQQLAATAVCTGQSITLNNGGIHGGTWLSGDASIATVQATTGIATGVNVGTVLMTYYIPLGGAITVSLGVGNGSTIYGPSVVCQGQTIVLSCLGSGGVWSSSNTSVASVVSSTGSSGGSGSGGATAGSTSSTASTVTVKGMSGGSATIFYTRANGCPATKSIMVTATAPITGTPVVCEGQTVSLSNSIAGGTWSSSSGSNASVSATGVVSGILAGTPRISYMLAGGCFSTSSVTVRALAPITGGTASMCQNGAMTLANATPGGGTWSSDVSGRVSVSSVGLVTGLAGGIGEVYFNTAGGCVATRTVTVIASPVLSGTTVVCAGQTSILSSSATGGIWSSSNASYATVNAAGVVSGVGAGVVRVTYTLPTGCQGTTTLTVGALQQTTGTANACAGQTLTLTNTTPGGGVWSSSNTTIASVSSSGVVSCIAGGMAMIRFTTPAGCVATKTVTVNSIATITGSMSACVGQTTPLSNSVSGGNWSTSSGSIANVSASGVVTGVGSGTVRVFYTLSSGCQGVATVTVNALQSTTGGTNAMCVNNAQTLLNSTPGGGIWSSSNTAVATVSASGYVRSTGVGVARISFTVNGSGCVSTRTITVNACRMADTTTTTAAAAIPETQDVRLFPNPNRGMFVLKGSIEGSDAAVEVVNMTGQIIYRRNITSADGIINQQIELPPNLANSMYLLNLRTGAGSMLFHFVLEQ